MPGITGESTLMACQPLPHNFFAGNRRFRFRKLLDSSPIAINDFEREQGANRVQDYLIPRPTAQPAAAEIICPKYFEPLRAAAL